MFTMKENRHKCLYKDILSFISPGPESLFVSSSV
jgi:hypothetical protein